MTGEPTILWCWPEAVTGGGPVLQALERIGRVVVRETLPSSEDSASILVPRLTQSISSGVLTSFPLLKLIATPSTGTDHIDLQAAAMRGIQVISLRNDRDFLDSLQSTAELTWLLILACMRRFREANHAALRADWNAAAVRGSELIGKTIGIVGLGRLGTMVARFAQAFRMRVIAHDVQPIAMQGVEPVTLDALLQESDIVTIHVHLDDSTRGLIGERELNLMKPGSVLVNTSRGAILDESALLAALKSSRLAAAGLDVLVGERDAGLSLHPLIQYAQSQPNLILTPHVGGCTVEAQQKAFLHIAHKIAETWKTIR